MTASVCKPFVLCLGLVTAGLAASVILSALRPIKWSRDVTVDEPSTEFAFVYQDAFNRGLFLASVDGRVRARLTRPAGDAVDVSPVWSPDLDPCADGYQGKIAFVRRQHANFAEGDVFVVDPDGSHLQLVAALKWDRDPVPLDQTSGGSDGENTLAWSPNGREIVFAYTGCLWSVEVSSGGYRRLLQVDSAVADPSISAARQQIAFHRGGDLAVVDFDFDDAGLMVVDPSSLEKLTSNGFIGMEEHPAWSPDGRCLAYRRDGMQLVVRDMDTGDECIAVRAGVQSELTWSPDGMQIGFCTEVGDDASSSTWGIVRLDRWKRDEREIVPVPLTPDLTRREIEADWHPGWGSSSGS